MFVLRLVFGQTGNICIRLCQFCCDRAAATTARPGLPSGFDQHQLRAACRHLVGSDLASPAQPLPPNRPAKLVCADHQVAGIDLGVLQVTRAIAVVVKHFQAHEAAAAKPVCELPWV